MRCAGITDDPNIGSDGEDDLPRLESSVDSDSNADLTSESGKQVDLFSEIHLNELKKLEKQVEQMESEKISLTQNLRESQSVAERSQAELQSLMTRLVQLGSRIQSLDHIRDQAAQNIVSKNEVRFCRSFFSPLTCSMYGVNLYMGGRGRFSVHLVIARETEPNRYAVSAVVRVGLQRDRTNTKRAGRPGEAAQLLRRYDTVEERANQC